MIKTGLDSNFINRVIWTSLWLTAIVCLFFLGYKHYVPATFRWGFLIGALCGIGNLFFLKMIITSLIRPGGVKWAPGIVGAVCIHAVLGVFFYSIWTEKFSNAALLLGFTICFIVMFLKAVSTTIAQSFEDRDKIK